MITLPENKHLRFFIILLYCLLGAFATWLLFRYVIGLLAPFIIAFLVAKLIEKPVKFFTNQLRIPRPASSGIWTLIAYGGVGGLLYLLVSMLVSEMVSFFSSLPEPDVMLAGVLDSLKGFLSILPDGMSEWLTNTITNLFNGGITLPDGVVSSAGSMAVSAAGNVPSVLLGLIITLAATYFTSADYWKIKSAISKNMPKKWHDVCSKLKSESMKTLGKYIRALGILMCITFVELTIGFFILGIDYAVVIAFFTALIDALPVFGVGGLLIPWAIYNLITGNFFLAAGLAILYGVVDEPAP